jgi:hypothetical protein
MLSLARSAEVRMQIDLAEAMRKSTGAVERGCGKGNEGAMRVSWPHDVADMQLSSVAQTLHFLVSPPSAPLT